MEPVKARNVIIGKGRPKICVPIVAVTAGEIFEEARLLAERSIDIAEWRASGHIGRDAASVYVPHGQGGRREGPG